MPLPSLRRYGFRLRLLAVVVLLQTAIVAALAWFAQGEAIGTLYQETERRARDDATLLTALLEPALLAKDEQQVQRVLQQVVRHQALDYVAVLDAQGKLVDAIGWSFKSPLPTPAPRLDQATSGRYDVRAPLVRDGRALGDVQFGLSLATLDQSRSARLPRTLLAGLLSALLVTALLLPIGAWLTRRLSHLERAGRGLADGDLSLRLAASGHDELDRLARALNAMAENLTQRLQALDASERRLAGVIRGTFDAFFDWEAATQRTYYSPRLASMLGYQSGDHFDAAAVGIELVHEDERAAFDVARLAHLRGETAQFSLETRLRRKDGGYLWCHIRGQAERRADGRVVRFAGSISDINDQKIAQERAAHLLAEQKALLDNAVAGIVHIRNRTIVNCNRRFEEIFGFQPGEALGLSTREISVDEEHYRSSGERIYPILQAGDTYSADTTMRRRDGSIFAMSSSGRLIDASQPELGSIWVYQDRTEQQKTLTALSAEKDLVDALINSLPGIFFQTDKYYRLQRWNRNLEVLTGHDELTLRRMSMIDLVAPEWRPLIAMQAERCLASRDPSQNETWLQTADDDRHPFLLSLAVVGEGDSAQLLGTGVDIHDRRRAEAEVRRVNETLELRVRERTAELTAANSELEAFSYSVSHDLSAPLRAIDGFARIIVEDYAKLLDEPGRRYLERVRAASQHMHAIIDNMLHLSRITRNEMRAEHCDLAEIAQTIAADLQAAEPARQVAIKIAAEMPVWGDANLLRIAMENLLRNAWKFTARRTDPSIEVGRLVLNGEPVYFVRDNGAGFDMRYANKLFKAFQRLHQHSEFEGNGIGLAIVSRVIHRHGGRIWVEAAVEQGATFYFTLQHKDTHHGSGQPNTPS